MTTPSMKRRMVLDALAVGALAPALTSPAARAQSAPDRPLRVVVPFAGGNTLDTALRQLADMAALAENWRSRAIRLLS